MSTLYTKALDKNRTEIFYKLSNFADEFVLAGGTAIMLILNHRRSFDFDCFSEEPLDKSLLQKARHVFGNNITVQVDNPDLLLFTTPEGAKIDFVHFPYPPLHKIIKNEPISLFDLTDLAANKAYTIGRRATWRDYVDMFFLLTKFGLAEIIAKSKNKFKGEFGEKLFLEQLVYYDDLEIVPIEFLQKSHKAEEIKENLQQKVHEYTSIKINNKS